MPRRKRRLASRIREYIRGLLAFLFSNIGVIVLVVAYTIAEKHSANRLLVLRDQCNVQSYFELKQNTVIALLLLMVAKQFSQSPLNFMMDTALLNNTTID
ncbi:unnamed protein product [Leptidea sinapis]|uniref:Uncharacterized protein n=1 Tax=Leptidea sinapis TaxID=189913 RepID=A0A5E4QWA7_9NEOP|nr:unnamed protein product [Leptidea sinapis]